MTNEILTTALRFAAQGIVVVPVATDGSKRPGVGSWKQYQERQPTQDELLNWFNNDQVQGLGVITGPISNNLLMIVEPSQLNPNQTYHTQQFSYNMVRQLS
jgi:hypothetical protein